MSVEDRDKAADGNGKPGAEGEKKWEISPIEVTHPETVDAKAIRLFKEPPWQLRMTIEDDRSYLKIKVVRAAPLSHPDDYICFLDAKDEVICMVDSIREIQEAARGFAQEDLDRRYLTAQVLRIRAIRMDFGVSYWDVETDRGQREFVAKDVAENAQWMGDNRLLILDVDGNRFEIRDLAGLDKKSLGLIDLVL